MRARQRDALEVIREALGDMRAKLSLTLCRGVWRASLVDVDDASVSGEGEGESPADAINAAGDALGRARRERAAARFWETLSGRKLLH